MVSRDSQDVSDPVSGICLYNLKFKLLNLEQDHFLITLFEKYKCVCLSDIVF